MRPKKRILLINANPQQLSVRRYMLFVKGYAVFSAESAEEALAVAAQCNPDVAVLVWPLKSAAQLLAKLHGTFPSTSTMVLAEGLQVLPEELYPHAKLYGNIHADEFLDRLKVLAAGKRGPRKKPVGVVTVADAEARRIA